MSESTTILTVEQIIDKARKENLSNKQIRSLLFHGGHDYKVEFPAIRDALGREKGDDGEANRIANQKAAEEAAEAVKSREAEIAKEHARKQAEAEAKQAEQAAAKQAAIESVADGCIIWCDAAPNTVTKVVNRFGKQQKFDNGGYRVGLLAEGEAGDYEANFQNRQCPDQFAGECFAVLKAIEFAAERGLKSATIRNDRIGGFEATTKRGYAGTKYLWVAKKIATESGIEITFDVCSGSENRADKVSRKEVA